VRLARDFAIAQKLTPGLTSMMDLYGIGDHGGGPTRAILDQGDAWVQPSNPDHVMPRMQFGTAQNYFTGLEKQIAPDSPVWDYASIAKGYTPPPAVAGKVNIPTWKSELYFEYHRGVMTTQANHKRNMRDSEEWVLNAEKWSSLAWVLAGRAYPAVDLTEDWKKVLFNQFHDLAAGSGIGVIYKDAQKDYDVVRWSTNEIDAGALATLAENIDTRTEPKFERSIPVVVWNPLGWDRKGDVTVKIQDPIGHADAFAWSGNEKSTSIHFAHVVDRDAKTGVATVRISDFQVPALGYTRLFLIPATNEPQQLPTSNPGHKLILGNTHLELRIDKISGCITNLIENETKFETLAAGGCGNQLQFFKDTPRDYDAWNVDPGTLDQAPATIEKADVVEEFTSADGTPAVRVTRTWQNSKFVQTISLQGDQVDIENDIDC